MAKLKDVLKLFNEQLNSNEFSALLSASNPMEVEITEEGFNEIKTQVEGLLTVESAQTHKDVKFKLHQQHEKTIKKQVEAKLAKLADLLDASESFTAAATIDEKITAMEAALNEKLTSNAPDKTVAQKLKKEIETLNAQIAQVRQEKETEVSQAKNESEVAITKFALSNYLQSKYKLAEPYHKDKIRKTIFEDAFAEITSKAIIKRNGDGFELFDKETPEKPLFLKNNKPAGVDDLVAPIIKDYLQVSDSQQQKTTTTQQQNQPSVEFKPGTMAYDVAMQKQAALQGMTAN